MPLELAKTRPRSNFPESRNAFFKERSAKLNTDVTILMPGTDYFGETALKQDIIYLSTPCGNHTITHFRCTGSGLRSNLRAAAWKIQTSPDSSKNSISILFHKRNPYIELFSKMEFKRFSEFHFSRNRVISAFAQMGLAANPKIGKFCKCWAASQSKIKREVETLFYIK